MVDTEAFRARHYDPVRDAGAPGHYCEYCHRPGPCDAIALCDENDGLRGEVEAVLRNNKALTDQRFDLMEEIA